MYRVIYLCIGIMEKKMEIAILGCIGTTMRTHSFI